MDVTVVMDCSAGDRVQCLWSSVDGQLLLVLHSRKSNTISVYDDNFGLLKATPGRSVTAMSCYEGKLLLCSDTKITVAAVSADNGEISTVFSEGDVCDGEIGRKFLVAFVVVSPLFP